MGYYFHTGGTRVGGIGAKAQFNYANSAQQGAIWAFIMGVITTAIAIIFIRSNSFLTIGLEI